METLRIVAVSFQSAGKIFDFNACDLELSIGDKVIVETERGRALAYVVAPPREETPDSSHPKLKNVLRIANEDDLEMAAQNADREAEALKFCKQRVSERNMEMKLVRAEYLFDGSKIVFYFTADGRVDFRDLVRDLAQHFRTRIEMRQIGVRDEAKMVGGLGVCGRELCCCTHLRNFAPVSVKMAKAQGLALNPSKISGQCGRLLCCLGYEYETYNDLRKNLPKCGKKVTLPSGPAEVVAVNVLGQKITVNEEGQRREIHICELEGRKDAPCCKQSGEKQEEPAKPETGIVDKDDLVQQQDNEKKSNRRRGRRRSGSGRSGDGKEKSPQQQERRSKDRRESDQEKTTADKKPLPEQKTSSAEPQDGAASRPRRRRRRPRNRKTSTPQSDNSNNDN